MLPELFKLTPYDSSENQYLLPSVTVKYMATIRIAKAQSPILRLSIMRQWLMAEVPRMAMAQDGSGVLIR